MRFGKVEWSAHGLVERHFAGEVGRWSERRMWRHLRGCESCRSRYRTRAMLEAMEPGAEDLARMRLGRGLFTRRRPLLPALTLGGALVAGTAALAVIPRLPPTPHTPTTAADEAGFRERSGAGAETAGPSITVVRIPESGSPTRAGAVVHADEALAFTYRNPSATAFRYLMIFARDESGHVYWYWPAWRDPAQAPAALPITAADTPVELREGVRHPLAPGALTLSALFTNQAFDVNAIEAAARGGQAGLQALATQSQSQLVQERVEVLP
jgi:hypothetical protein